MVARAERWEEEVLLLREEMRRVITKLDAQAKWWRTQGTRRQVSDPELASGLRGYAEKQAAVCKGLATDFASLWLQGIEDSSLSVPKTWPSEYLKAKSLDRQVKRRVERVKARQRVIGTQNVPVAIEGEAEVLNEEETRIAAALHG